MWQALMKQVLHMKLTSWAAALLYVVKTKKLDGRRSRSFTQQRFKWRLPSTTSTQTCKHCETSVCIVCVLLWEAETGCLGDTCTESKCYDLNAERVRWWHWNDMTVSLSLEVNYKRDSIICVVPPTCYDSDERWATLKTIRGLWLNSSLKGYKPMIRPQVYNMLSGFIVCWVDDHQSSYLLRPKRIISLVHRGWIHLSLCFLPPAALFLKHSLGKYTKIISFISKLN